MILVKKVLTKICKSYQYDRMVRKNYFPHASRLYDVTVVIWYPREAEHKRIPGQEHHLE